MRKYTRKDLAELFNIGKETLRYYENINLLPNPTRNKSGYRVYKEVFPKDCKKAFELGERLVQK